MRCFPLRANITSFTASTVNAEAALICDRGVFPIAKYSFNLIVTIGPAKYPKAGPFLIISVHEPRWQLGSGQGDILIAQGEQHYSHPALLDSRTRLIGGADVGNEKVKFIRVILGATAKSLFAIQWCSGGTLYQSNR